MTTLRNIINTINSKRAKTKIDTANVKERMGLMSINQNFIRLGYFKNSFSYRIYK
jgi:hypothetical protein